jgi:hypothetical protein
VFWMPITVLLGTLGGLVAAKLPRRAVPV